MKHRIVEVRRAKGVSQGELADRIGSTQSMVGKLERGERKMTFGWLSRIAQALDASTAELLDMTDVPAQVGDIDSTGRVQNLVPNPFMFQGEDDFDSPAQILDISQVGDLRSVGTMQDVIVRIPAHSVFIYAEKGRRPGKEFYNRLLAVWIVDGPADVEQPYALFIGQIMPGSLPDRHHLLPLNGPPIENAMVAWVSPIERIGLP